MTPEQRRHIENLILLCATCHALVDAESKQYTVAKLTKWKHDREDRFKSVGRTLRQRYLANISDDAATIDTAPPTSLQGYIAFLDHHDVIHELEDHETLQNTLRDVAKYIDRLRHLRIDDRQLLAAIVDKALVLQRTHRFINDVEVHPDDLKTIRIDRKNLSDYRIKRFSSTLKRHNLGHLLFDEEPSLRVSNPARELPWESIAEFLGHSRSNLKRLLCDLDFSIFD